MSPKEGQVPFLTAADLALRFFGRGWIDEEDLRAVVGEVRDSFGPEGRGLRAIPGWVRCRGFAEAYVRPDIRIPVDIEEEYAAVETEMIRYCLGVRRERGCRDRRHANRHPSRCQWSR